MAGSWSSSLITFLVAVTSMSARSSVHALPVWPHPGTSIPPVEAWMMLSDLAQAPLGRHRPPTPQLLSAIQATQLSFMQTGVAQVHAAGSLVVHWTHTGGDADVSQTERFGMFIQSLLLLHSP